MSFVGGNGQACPRCGKAAGGCDCEVLMGFLGTFREGLRVASATDEEEIDGAAPLPVPASAAVPLGANPTGASESFDGWATGDHMETAGHAHAVNYASGASGASGAAGAASGDPDAPAQPAAPGASVVDGVDAVGHSVGPGPGVVLATAIPGPDHAQPAAVSGSGPAPVAGPLGIAAGSTWPPFPTEPGPAGPEPVRSSALLSKVTIGLAGLLVAMVAAAVVIPLVSHTKKLRSVTTAASPTSAPASPASPASAPAVSPSAAPGVPSLSSLLSTSPSPGYAVDKAATPSGYLTPAQVQQALGTPLPSGGRMYRVTWVGPQGAVVLEEAVLTPSAHDAVDFAAGMNNSMLQKGGTPFAVTGMTGSVAGEAIPESTASRSRSVTVVARGDVAILYIADAADAPTATALAIQAAQRSGTALPLDTASLGTAAPGPGTGTGAPAWEGALGAGVTLVQPGSAPPLGTTSPGGVVLAAAAAVNAGQLSAECQYLQPSAQAACASAVAGQSDAGTSIRLTLGFVAVKGNQALVGTVGQDCEPNATPVCATNEDPAAVFDSGKSFDTLYAEAVAANNSSDHVYSLIPCVEVGGHWYVYVTNG